MITARSWRSVGYKLPIGLGIAGVAVYMQDPQPQVQGRGQGTVSSQTVDLAQLGTLSGHKAAVTAVGLAVWWMKPTPRHLTRPVAT